MCQCVVFFNGTATTEIHTYVRTLSLPDALPVSAAMTPGRGWARRRASPPFCRPVRGLRSPAAGRGRHAVSRRDRRHAARGPDAVAARSEEHTSELQSLMRISYAVFCLKKKTRSDTYSYESPSLLAL